MVGGLKHERTTGRAISGHNAPLTVSHPRNSRTPVRGECFRANTRITHVTRSSCVLQY